MVEDLSGNASASVGVVVIGRNEGVRLAMCLQSVVPAGHPVVYVDSGSSDGSVATASSFGVEILGLDPVRPFSAARARNEGFERMFEIFPSIRFVQFLDADCTLLPGWIDVAAAALHDDLRRSAVFGILIERNADASVYNRLCAFEWRSQPGDLHDYSAFGGIAMIRADVFRQLRGYNPDVIAGEDSEFGVRMGLAGYKITKLGQPMATHDANMTSFRQWWRRAVRAGHAIGQRAHLNGATILKDCVRERNSTWFWGIGVPALIVLTLVCTRGFSLVLLGGYAVLAYRIVRHRLSQGEALADALLYAKFNLLAKFGNAVGLVRFHLNRHARRYEIIEYK